MKKTILFLVILLSFSKLFADSDDNYDGKLLQNEYVDGHHVVRRSHSEFLRIDRYDRDSLKTIYDSPLTQNVIGNIETGSIEVSELFYLDNNQLWLKVQYKNIVGYIFCKSGAEDKYASFHFDTVIGRFDDKWHTIEYKNSYYVPYSVDIWDSPGVYGDKIGKIEVTSGESVYFTTSRITVNDKYNRWVEIEYKGIKGWISGGCLEYSRGGHTFTYVDSLLIDDFYEYGP